MRGGTVGRVDYKEGTNTSHLQELVVSSLVIVTFIDFRCKSGSLLHS